MKDIPRQMGYRAAVLGQLLGSCPFMKVSELPTHTGESIAHWRTKVEAWEQGWHECVNERPALSQHDEAAHDAPEMNSHL